MYIKDSVEIEVRSTEEALELMHKSQKKRVVACTDLNAESSRSHSIFTIRIVQATYDANDDFQAKVMPSIGLRLLFYLTLDNRLLFEFVVTGQTQYPRESIVTRRLGRQ
jgi:hypothetical protein